MKKIFYLLTSVLLAMIALNGHSQTPQVIPFEQADQMSKTVYDLLEDSSRKIWMGTDEGLYCWTGTQLKHYFNSDYSYEYTGIQEDKQGRIWCLNFSSQLFYLENDSLKAFYVSSDSLPQITSFQVDQFPSIFLGTEKGLLSIDFTSKKIKFPLIKKEDSILVNPFPDSLHHFFQVSKLISWNNHLYLTNYFNFIELNNNGTPTRICSVQMAESKHRNVLKEAFILSTDEHVITEVCYLEDNKVVSELIFHSWNNKEDSFAKEYEGIVQTIFSDESMNWFGTSEGVKVFTKKNKRVYAQAILPQESISSIIKDAEGVLWISTTANGVFKVASQAVLSLSSAQHDFREDPIIAITSANEHGLFLFSNNGKLFKKGGNELIQLAQSDQPLGNAYFNPFRKELGFAQNNLSYSVVENRFLPNPYYSNNKSISLIDKGIALTSNSGSAQLKIQLIADSSKLKDLKLLYKKELHYQKEGFYVMMLRRQRSQFNHYDPSDSSFYISYVDGLYHYKNDQEKEVKWENKSILLTGLTKLESGGIICSAVGGEILQIDYPEITLLAHFDFRVKKLLAAKDHLFIVSKDGILNFDLKSRTTEWITTSDGLPSNWINTIELFHDSVYVATSGGISIFSQDYSFKNLVKPLVSIENVQINFEDVVLQNSYELSYKQNNIGFTLGGVANKSNGSFLYHYRLVGLDSHWVSNSSTNNSILFGALPSGEFQLQVKVTNEDGVESEIKQIYFTIAKPYYRRWWFYLLCIFLIAGTVSLFFVFRIRMLNRQSALKSKKDETEKELARTQLIALRSQMNPHFIFNALNSIQDYIIRNDKELAADYLGLFADLIRKYLHFSNQDELTIGEELESLKMYLELEKVRFEETLQCTIEIDPEIDLESNIPIMLVQPFVENAIKHGLLHKKYNRELKLSFKKLLNGVEVEVYDNGVGRITAAQINLRKDKAHQSFATSAQQKRIALINQQNQYRIAVQYKDLVNDFDQPNGTIVNIRITFTEFL